MLLAPASAHAQYARGAPQRAEPVERRSRARSSKVGIDQKIGQQLPLDLAFRDEDGQRREARPVLRLAPPVVLALAYYECPMLCTQVLNGMTGALKTLSFDAGKDFDVVVVSIDPKDNFRLAANKKQSYLDHYGRPADRRRLALPDRHRGVDQAARRRASGSATPTTPTSSSTRTARRSTSRRRQGVVARYLLGIDFAPRDLRLALVEASNNELGYVTDKVLLLCYHYDPSVGKYGVAILNAVRIGFVATVTGFLAFLFVSLRAASAAPTTGPAGEAAL